MDAGSDFSALGQAGYAITGSGGGGTGGQYMFASLQELDEIIADWEDLRDRIRARDDKFQRAKSLIAPPAEDVMSRLQAHAAGQSLDKAQAHNRSMSTYADEYITKLKASRSRYATTDTDNATQLRDSDKG